MKRFYNNTINSKAATKALQVFALLCVLFGVSATAWGATCPGDFNSWTADASTVIDDGYTVCLTKGTTYQFKIENNKKWYGSGGTISGNTNNYKLYSGDQSNCQISAQYTGVYTIKQNWINDNEVEITVTFPTVDLSTFNAGTKTYLAPGVWNTGGAGFAAYYWNECTNANAWARGTIGCNNNYYFSAPDGNWTHLKYVRLNSANAEMNWDNDWDQTSNLTYDNSKTLYTISGWGTNNVATGSWSAYSSTAPVLEEPCQQIIFQLNKGNANQNDGWNGNSPYLYAWDCNGNAVVDEQQAINGTYVLEPGTTIPIGINFVSEYDHGGNKGKTGDIIGYDGNEFEPNKKYTITLTGAYNGDGYDRVFSYTITSEDIDDFCNQKYTYSVAGTFNNWETDANSCNLAIGQSCEQEFDLTAGTHKFKIVKEHSEWFGKDNLTIVNTTDGVILDSGGDVVLTAENDGIYTFTFGEDILDKDGIVVKIAYAEKEEPVLISRLPQYDANMQNVDLYGYVQKTLCQVIGDEKGKISDYGFVICPGSATSLCVPNSTSQRLKINNGVIARGDEFTYKVNYDTDHIIPNAVYGYRAYAVINDKMYLSTEVGTFMLPGECNQPAINLDNPELSPITYTIDASLGEEHADDCNLVYGSLQTALDRLLSIANDDTIEPAYKYTSNNGDNNHNSIDLNVPIIFNIMYFDDTPEESSIAYCYEGDTKAGVSGGGESSENAYALIIKDINRSKTDTESYTLTLQNGGEGARPWLHHVILRNSRNVVLDNLALFSDPSEKNHDDALEFDINSKQWDNLGGIGAFENAQIVVKNCMIGSNGFTGVHASAYDGITFINNEFEAIMEGATDNDIDYGASAKFIACKNIKFVRNNFRGAHATLLWIQECEDALFMNNVFWNTNQYAANCSAVRLVDQFNHPVSDIGFYYNTFYLQEDGKESTHKYDFLHYSSLNNGNTPSFSNIEFMYNNCYSYDTSVPGKDQDPVTKQNVNNYNYCPNNFWSKNGNATFAFGNCSDGNTYNINVENEVCGTTATGPSSLVVRGELLNKGERPDSDLAIALGVTDTDRSDRYNDEIRPETVTAENIAQNKGWTFGAYQSQQGVEVKKIYWLGLSTDWDDRNNWGYYPSEQTIEGRGDSRVSETIERLSCINTLSEELQVVIPEKSLLGMSYEWPVVPKDFDKGRSNMIHDEEVSAGKGIADFEPTQYAYSIDVEYGAAIKGVENLGAAVHYTQATSHFVAPRSQWVLVGTVVKPFTNGVGSETRSVKSGDYFLSYEPNVYMHEATINNQGQAAWNKAFANLEEPVTPDQAFAINIPDEYGNGRIPAKYYYNPYLFPSHTGSINDGTIDKSFSFNGRFANDAGMPRFDIVNGEARMMNNSYPYNLSAEAVEDVGKGTVSYYDYSTYSFRALGDDDVMLKPQHGFVFTPTTTDELVITSGMLADGNTRSRSLEQPQPSFAIGLFNTGNNTNMSEIIVRYDAEHTPGVAHNMDTKKIYSPYQATPDLYMLMYDAEYARIHTPKAEQVIPLGIELKESMSVKFAVLNNRQFSQVILVDKLTGKEFDLLQHSYTTGILAAGKLEGRYYLNLVVEGEYDSDPETGDSFITTDIEDTSDEMASINIVTDNTASHTIRVIGNNTLLQTIYVSDMSGRTHRYDVDSHAVTLQLPVAGGVYLVQVIGDNATRTEKVIVK